MQWSLATVILGIGMCAAIEKELSSFEMPFL
jgi:hypothetical protein